MALIDRNGIFKDWNTLKHENDLQNKLFFSGNATYKCHTI